MVEVTAALRGSRRTDADITDRCDDSSLPCFEPRAAISGTAELHRKPVKPDDRRRPIRVRMQPQRKPFAEEMPR
jgi:hypothetical protein